MAKFYGAIGYARPKEKSPGVWVNVIEEHKYYGELLRNSRRLEGSGVINDNINISNEISIVADPFAFQNFHFMQYIVFMGAKWKISNVEVKYPRLVLTTGGLYNGQEIEAPRII